MGYHMNQQKADFVIPFEQINATLAVIKNLKGNFSWVNTEKVAQATNIEEAFNAWRWIIELDANDDIINIQFRGEKLGDDKDLFDCIAQYVKEGSYIQMVGEDGEIWRWVFRNKQCIEVAAVLTFPE